MHLILTLILALLAMPAFGIPVLHSIRPDSTFTQISTLEACTLSRYSGDITSCNPGLFKRDKSQGVHFSFASVTDGDSVETGKKLIFSPIKESFLRELFEEKSYSSWDGNTSIDFKTPLFHLYYDPVTVTADVLIINPSFPEVSMALVKAKRLGIVSGYDLYSDSEQTLGIGANIFYYQRKQYLDSFSLVDLTNNEIGDLIHFQTKSGAAADLGLAYHNNSNWVPDFSLLIKNLNSDYKTNDERISSERYLWPVLVYENYSRIGIGKDFISDYGAFTFELSVPFQGVYSYFYKDYTTVAGQYSLSNFEWLIGASKYQKTTGIKFSSKSTSVGIFYSQNQPLGDFREQTEKVAGIQLGVML